MTIPANQFYGDNTDSEMIVQDTDGTNEVTLDDPPQDAEDAENLNPLDGNAAEQISTVEKPLQEHKTTFTVQLPNFSKVPNRKWYSDAFPLGGYNWGILVFPQGNNCDDLSVYLDVADAKSLNPGWQRYATFALTVINHREPSKNVTREASHRFHAEESDWGFTQFMKLSLLHDVNSGFLADDTLHIRATVSLPNNMQPSFWNNYVNYDSKKETGFVGLKNQGATCYMNSLLQTLFHTSRFRKAVYAMPTETENETKSIPLALQRVFYRLQTYNTSVGTKELTKSFGWDAYDAFTQHDVQELNRVLCDNLEEKMKGTIVEGAIAKLFEGKVINYVKCVNVDYQSTRTESFYDLSLNVKGCKDVYESFDKYIEVEMLDGDNKYAAEGHGLQDARKGVKFVTFPPVLHLQLKRFEYDPSRDTMVKVNDKYEFFQTIHLDKYLADDADRTVPNTFELHSVLVHSGDVSGGHYYAFIKPRADPQWYKFDDERVLKVTPEQAMQENFGGDDEVQQYPPYGGRNIKSLHKKFSNAYMLVYIRKADFEDVLGAMADTDIAEHLRNRFEQERLDEEARKKERQEAHLYMTVKVATDDDFRAHNNIDLTSFEKVQQFRILKTQTYRDLKNLIAEKLNIPPPCQRFWNFVSRQNKTCRPDLPISPIDELNAIGDTAPSKGQDGVRLYLETVPVTASGVSPEDESLYKPHSTADVLLFFKFYDPLEQKLEYVGNFMATNTQKVAELLPVMDRLKKFPPSTRLEVFEEVRPTMIERVDLNNTIGGSELENGDILCFQKVPVPDVPLAQAPDYYDYVVNRVTVKFHKLEKPKEVDFTLELSKKMHYDEVAAKVAEKVGTEPMKIRFTQCSSNLDGPKSQPFKRTERVFLHEMLTAYSQMVDMLFYEKLEYSLLELETKRVFKIPWFNAKVEEVKVFTVLVAKEGSVGDLITAIREAGAPLEGSGEIRLVEVYHNKITRFFTPSEGLNTIMELNQLRAEEIPDEQLPANVGRDDKVLAVMHVSREGHMVTNFGNPFCMLVKAGESAESVRGRIQKKLGIADDEFAKWRLVVVLFTRPETIADDDIVLSKLVNNTDYLALEHQDTAPRSVYRSYAEKPVKIYN